MKEDFRFAFPEEEDSDDERENIFDRLFADDGSGSDDEELFDFV